MLSRTKNCCFCPMFVRKKKNPSGVVSIQVIDKSRGKYRVVKTIGSSKDPTEVFKLYNGGRKWISTQTGVRDMFALEEQQREDKQVMEHLLNNVENILLNGPQQILNQVYRIVVTYHKFVYILRRHLCLTRLFTNPLRDFVR